MLEQFATVEEVDRPAAKGDFVSVDLKATKDGEPIEGATSADLLYEVGSGLLVDGIDERLEGVEPGTVLEFEAPLPEGFGERAGEEVIFEVAVNEVKERILPDLDDAWVDENTEFETVEEMRGELEAQLGQVKLQAVSRQFAERALSTLVEQVDVDLPEGLIRSEMDDQLHSFVHRLEDNELTLDDYFSATGLSQEQFLDDLRQQAARALRNQLVLEAVAADADIEITPEEVSSVIQGLAARSGDPVAYLQAFRQSGRELALAGDILRNRALDAILSTANPVDEEGNPVDLRLDVTEVEAEVVEAEPVEGVVEGEVVSTAAKEEE
jgi:trigger factor